MSSIIAKKAGTNTRESKVESTNPPMTAMAIGERNSPPIPNARALGVMPATMASVVMMIGRARFWPASTSAASRSMPASIDVIAKSTIIIAFLVTMPMSIKTPIHTGVVSCLPASNSPRIAPPIESGSETKIVMGCRKLPNRSTSTA